MNVQLVNVSAIRVNDKNYLDYNEAITVLIDDLVESNIPWTNNEMLHSLKTAFKKEFDGMEIIFNEIKNAKKLIEQIKD